MNNATAMVTTNAAIFIVFMIAFLSVWIGMT
jgi:hypothetical protein